MCAHKGRQLIGWATVALLVLSGGAFAQQTDAASREGAGTQSTPWAVVLARVFAFNPTTQIAPTSSDVVNQPAAAEALRSALAAAAPDSLVVSERQLPDGTREFVVQIAEVSSGSGSTPSIATAEPGTSGTSASKNAETASTPAVERRTTMPPFPDKPVTGLIVDCRSLTVCPSMSPKIVDAYGREIWGTMVLDPARVTEDGIAAYCRTLDEAKADARAGSNPLVIAAVSAAGRSRMYPSDAVVAPADGELISALNACSGFLQKLQVCFVVDAR